MRKNQFWQYLVGSIAINLLIPTVANAHTGIGMGLGIDRFQPKLQSLLFRIGGGAILIGAGSVLINN